MLEFDPHIHSIASGHSTENTITDLAKKAFSVGLNMIGITDHAPTTLGAGSPSYFRNLTCAQKKRCGIDILYGVELNIINKSGDVDLDDEILKNLDYAIISMHPPIYTSGTMEENTFAYIAAMKHPKVKIIGHCDDKRFPVDFEALILAAKHYSVVLEINNSSLSPDSYRGDVRENTRKILSLCKKHRHPIVLSSDSHGVNHVGDFRYAMEMVQETAFPEELILNSSSKRFLHFIK